MKRCNKCADGEPCCRDAGHDGPHLHRRGKWMSFNEKKQVPYTRFKKPKRGDVKT